MAVVLESIGIREEAVEVSTWGVNCGSVIQIGDLLIYAKAWRVNGQSFNPSTTGWAAIVDNVAVNNTTIGVYWKIADGQEAGGTGPSVSSSGGTRGSAALARISGHDPVSPIVGAQYATAGGVDVVSGSVTPIDDDGLLFVVATQSASSSFVITVSNGNITITERVDSNITSNVTLGVATGVKSGGANSTTATATRLTSTGDVQIEAFYIKAAAASTFIPKVIMM